MKAPTQERPVWQRVTIGLVITVFIILGNTWWTDLQAQWVNGTMVDNAITWVVNAWGWFVFGVMGLALVAAIVMKLMEWAGKRK